MRMNARGLAVAGGAIALLLGAQLALARTGPKELPDRLPPPAATPPPAAPREPGLNLTTPHVDLWLDGTRGKVDLRAPYSSVKVDADGGEVKVRAPYLNLDVRW
jgi:hypothetical protein